MGFGFGAFGRFGIRFLIEGLDPETRNSKPEPILTHTVDDINPALP